MTHLDLEHKPIAPKTGSCDVELLGTPLLNIVKLQHAILFKLRFCTRATNSSR